VGLAEEGWRKTRWCRHSNSGGFRRTEHPGRAQTTQNRALDQLRRFNLLQRKQETIAHDADCSIPTAGAD